MPRTKKTASAKATRSTKAAPAKKASKPAKAEAMKLSALDAAAQVLAGSAEPMNCVALIDAMATKGLWTSPGGKTPHQTLYAAILREINVKGDEARFVKADRGRFSAGAATATSRATGKSARKIADGTPGPKSLSNLLRI